MNSGRETTESSRVESSDYETDTYYYRARYYDPAGGRFISEDPIAFSGGTNFYKYALNNTVSWVDPSGLYTLTGFTPEGAAQMTIAIGKLAAKLKNSCCLDDGLRKKLLGSLQPFTYGSGVTFIYTGDTVPGASKEVAAGVSELSGFLHNEVQVGKKALNGYYNCPPEGIIFHELIHLTRENFFMKTKEASERDAYGKAAACFGQDCSLEGM